MTDYDVVIVGAGVAGLSAGIYGARSGLRTAVVEAGVPGGLAATAAWIENYPGFDYISGADLVQKFAEHAEKFAEIITGAHIDAIEGSGPFTIRSGGDSITAGAIILATGTKHRHLGVPGEDELHGKGVTYCATCDGFFFKDKKAYIIGGGNTAVMDAIYLKNIGVDITVVHRRDELRAEQALQTLLNEKQIPVIWNSQVKEITGDGKVDGLTLIDRVTSEETEHDVSGVFVAIGVLPSNDLAKQLGVGLDDFGFIKVNREMRTNVPLVYGAGDITGGLLQIVAGAAEGAIAAMSAFKDLQHPYWAEKSPQF